MGKEIYRQLLQQLQNGQEIVMKTQFKDRQGEIRRDMTRQIVAGSPLERLVLYSLNKGIPVLEKQQDITILAEPFSPEQRLLVLGGGHIALPLVDFAAKVGFSVTVVDDRPSFADTSRFPQAKQVLCETFDKALEKFKITKSDYAVIITRGHRHDQTCLEQLLKGTEPFYTGMIGSRRRVGAVRKLLIDAGFSPQMLAHIHTPIGLDIGAVTPEEIAISITAELIACKRQSKEAVQNNDALHKNRSDMDFDVLRLLAEETDEAKSIVTVISTKGSVPRGAGAKMLVYPYGKIVGSIGGGCSEGAVINDARKIIGTGGYQVKIIDMTGDAAEDEGMVCGGIMQILIEDYC